MRNLITTSNEKRSLTVAALLLLALPCAASLYTVVTPGFQFPPNYSGAVTFQDLNLLGMPTVGVYGTVGGSNTLAPGSVTGVSLVDSFPDGGVLNLPAGLATMGWNTASPRQLSVNTAGIIDSYSGLRSYDTNALEVYVDPLFFLLATNSGGNAATNFFPSSNTGSPITNWLTLQAGSISDPVIMPGGISTVSINTNGLAPSILNTMQILTNIYVLPGPLLYTNLATNFNVAVVGRLTGVGQVANLTSGLAITNLPEVFTFTTNATTYTVTDSVPSLTLGPLNPNGIAPLVVNASPWTNGIIVTNSGLTYFAGVAALDFGGKAPYTNTWSITLASSSGTISGASVALSPGTGAATTLSVLITASGGDARLDYQVSVLATDASGQRAQISVPVDIFFHWL